MEGMTPSADDSVLSPEQTELMIERIDEVLARIDAAAERRGRRGSDIEMLLATKSRRPAGMAGVVRDVLVQVNTSGEESKGGFAPTVEATAPIIERLRASETLRPVGLMTIGANTSDAAAVRSSLSNLRMLRDRLRERFDEAQVAHLSMGMSGDLEIAVEEGATIVRVGSAIFGARP